VAILGPIASLIAACYISIGPPADRGAVPYFQIGGPILFMSIGAWMVLYRNWMRNQIQPNREYPLPPGVPPGTPPALIRDESTGQMRPTATEHRDLAATSDWIHFQVGRQMLPWLCCGCLQDADAGQALIVQESGLTSFEVPRCADCTRSERRNYWSLWFITMVLSLSAGMAAIASLRLDAAESCALIIFCLPLACALASFLASTVTAPFKIAAGDRDRGVVRLRFRNADFSRVVAEFLDHPSGDHWSADGREAEATAIQASTAEPAELAGATAL